MKSTAKLFVVFSIGFFAISSQTLLFREYLGTFASNDIALAFFFSSWFFWIAFSSWLNGLMKGISEKASDNFALISLAYIPAFILQFMLILNARRLAGIDAYEIFPFMKMLIWSFIVNAPVSAATGFLFPSACLWIRKEARLPVAKVYVLESLGAFAGGVSVTMLIIWSASPLLMFSISAAVLAAGPLFLSKTRKMAIGFFVAIVLFSCADFAGGKISESISLFKWSSLMPREAYRGSFTTSQAEYLYGEGQYGGSYSFLREGSSCESFPDAEGGGRTAAMFLCQKPAAKKVLVIGAGLNTSAAFLRIPQVEELCWSHYDGEYASKVLEILPADSGFSDRRFNVCRQDIRDYLSGKPGFYDIVIIDMPDATSSVINRYFTTEFYGLLKKSMADGAVLGVRIGGGENVIGPELAYIGASAKRTIAMHFAKFAVVPGESTWLLASDSGCVSSDPEILATRYSAVEGAEDIYPSAGLYSIYLPDREEKALNAYGAVRMKEELLVNRDRHPLAFIYSLLLALRQSDVYAVKIVERLISSGAAVFFIPVPLLLLSCLMLRILGRGGASSSAMLAYVLVFISGFISISTAIVLMFMYQTAYGSLYIGIGLLSAFFMMGLSLGGAFPAMAARASGGMSFKYFPVIALLLHVSSLFAMACSDAVTWPWALFFLLFLLQGFFNGIYFPLAAAMLDEAGCDTGSSGARLENADNFGALLGACSSGIIIFPFIGTSASLLLFAAIMLAGVSCVKKF